MNTYAVSCADAGSGPRMIDAETVEVSQHTLIFKDAGGSVVAAFAPPSWLRFELVGAKASLGVVGSIGSGAVSSKQLCGHVSPIAT